MRNLICLLFGCDFQHYWIDMDGYMKECKRCKNKEPDEEEDGTWNSE